MNKIHTTLITYLREETSADESKLALKLKSMLINMSEEAIIRLMFFNYRGRDDATDGLRLTNFGRQIMKYFFKGYEVTMPVDELLLPSHIIYIDHNATMPYYIDVDGFLIYDHHLGIKLKLADGRVSTLIEMEQGK